LADRHKAIGGSIRGDALLGLTEVTAAELSWKEFVRRVFRRLRIAVVLDPGQDFNPTKHKYSSDSNDIIDTKSGGVGGGAVAVARQSPEFGLHHVGSNKFRTRMTSHSELFKVCAVEWVYDYPSKEVLLSILNGYFDDLYIGDLNEKRAVAKFFVHVFMSANEMIQNSPKGGAFLFNIYLLAITCSMPIR
jgi:hypothetical protein